jgi:hypothetical protein
MNAMFTCRCRIDETECYACWPPLLRDLSARSSRLEPPIFCTASGVFAGKASAAFGPGQRANLRHGQISGWHASEQANRWGASPLINGRGA